MKAQFDVQSAYSRWLLYTAAGFSALAGIIHAYFMPEHFEEWIGYGLFFMVATVCQVLLALVLLAHTPPRRDVLWAGILGNAAIIGLWIVTRTVGIPVGPMSGEIEMVGVLDLTSKIAEMAVILCLAALLRET